MLPNAKVEQRESPPGANLVPRHEINESEYSIAEAEGATVEQALIIAATMHRC